ncbi:bacterio-opsin activator domain-containing protein [Haloarcula salina]|uniref:PAS domain-containing protein n=1 Tax=Haloarcula salina TaxID=1429914 RepID=A0AA41KBD9_9EURY|nr:bacterio-opsin activator domain-containing protein [Haloarcula salina]MBV0901000.1 PAS domain-containing protein [Haloarcula salina]
MAPSVADGHDEWSLLGPAIEALPIPFAVIDPEETVLAANRAWREFAGPDGRPTESDALGVAYREVAAAADGDHAGRVSDGLRAVLEGERSQVELAYPRHSPSSGRWYLLRAAPFTVDGTRFVAVAHVDITERKAREEALQRAHDICTDADRTFAEQVDALLEFGCEVLGTDFGTLSHVHGDEYVFEAVTAPPGVDLKPGETTLTDALPVCQHVVDHREPLALSDVAAQAPALEDPEWGIANYVGAPIVVDGDVYGTFCFYGQEPAAREYTQWDLTFVRILADWASYELERRRHADQLDALNTAFPDPSFVVDAEGRYLDCLTVPEALDRIVDDADSLLGKTLHDVLPDATADSLLSTVRDAISTDSFQSVEYRLDAPAGELWFEARVAPLDGGKYDPDTAIVVARDITEYKERQAALERQRDELEQLQRLNVLGREIMKALQGATTREAIEAAVCDHLTRSDLYRSVWVATRESESTVEPVAAAGVPGDSLETVSPHEHRLATDALATDEVVVVDDLTAVAQRSSVETDAPLVRDHSSVAAVPLTTGETTFGALLVYAPVGDAIGEREAEILGDLGQVIALAIQRVNSQRSLLSATAIELEFRITDSDSIYADVSAEFDCVLALERRVPTSDGTRLNYVRVHDADPVAVCRALAASGEVDACAVVQEATTDRSALLEVTFDAIDASPLDVLSDYGSAVTRAVAESGDLLFSAELAPETDVRAVVEAIREIEPTVELRSKQYLDQPVTTVSDFQTQVRERLTPKQATALQTAYARGYYDWPRESSAEELAETLGISAPTLHYRLRKAHDTVMASLFERDDGD